MVPWYTCTMVPLVRCDITFPILSTRVPVRTRILAMAIVAHTFLVVRTYVRTYNVMSQLSDWKRAHMCTENHVCFGRIHGSQLREGANAGQHTPTLSLPYTCTFTCTYTCTIYKNGTMKYKHSGATGTLVGVPWYHGSIP